MRPTIRGTQRPRQDEVVKEEACGLLHQWVGNEPVAASARAQALAARLEEGARVRRLPARPPRSNGTHHSARVTSEDWRHRPSRGKYLPARDSTGAGGNQSGRDVGGDNKRQRCISNEAVWRRANACGIKGLQGLTILGIGRPPAG